MQTYLRRTSIRPGMTFINVFLTKTEMFPSEIKNGKICSSKEFCGLSGSTTTQRQSLSFISRNSPGILRPPSLNYITVSIALNLKFILSSMERDMRLYYPSPTCIFLIITFQVLLENCLYPLHKHSKHLPAQTIQK